MFSESRLAGVAEDCLILIAFGALDSFAFMPNLSNGLLSGAPSVCDPLGLGFEESEGAD